MALAHQTLFVRARRPRRFLRASGRSPSAPEVVPTHELSEVGQCRIGFSIKIPVPACLTRRPAWRSDAAHASLLPGGKRNPVDGKNHAADMTFADH